jgi:hypothetical protein
MSDEEIKPRPQNLVIEFEGGDGKSVSFKVRDFKRATKKHQMDDGTFNSPTDEVYSIKLLFYTFPFDAEFHYFTQEKRDERYEALTSILEERGIEFVKV